MRLQWTDRALSDLTRLHEFLAPVNPRAATNIVQALIGATGRLLDHPRIGEKLEQYEPRELRRILVGNYEMRYEIRESTV